MVVPDAADAEEGRGTLRLLGRDDAREFSRYSS
jgi:hypothetical protein